MIISKKIKWIAASILLISTIFAVFYMLGSTDISMPSLFPHESGPRLLMSIDGFRLRQSENGRVSWQIEASSAELYENKEARLRDLSIHLNSEGGGDVRLISETGAIDTYTGNASLRGESGEVRVITSEGYLLTTNSLHWLAGEKIIRTHEPFKLLGNNIYLEGRGVSANVDIRKFVVEKNVKAVLQE